MSDTVGKFEGGCLCGAIRFIATGKPKGIYWCHCQSCRKHSGAPASVFVAFERAAYTIIEGEITKFDSTPGRTRRGFCALCGSTLTCESARLPTETHFHVGAFERPAELQPTRHVFSRSYGHAPPRAGVSSRKAPAPQPARAWHRRRSPEAGRSDRAAVWG